MPPVRAIKNQYRGINAHLHSRWQSAGGWSGFHGNHISDLMRALRPLLLPLGYNADLEQSLQIRRLDEPAAILKPESDVTIYDTNPARPKSPPRIIQPAPAELVMTLPAALGNQALSTKSYSAIEIYRLEPDSRARGKPVAWLELLSPSNKPGGSDVYDYLEKRWALLQSGLVFIELDYLHESPPTLKGIASYTRRRGAAEAGSAHAYHIVIIDPRPDLESGMVRVSGFGVDDPLPTVELPLSGSDVLPFDFGIPYQKTVAETLYAFELVDYAELPLNFDRYSPADQQRIAARMVAVLQAAHEGHDLESAPLPVNTPALEEALALIERWRAIG